MSALNSEYERQREENIQRNRAKLHSLGIESTKKELLQTKPQKKREREPREKKTIVIEPRRSSRLRGDEPEIQEKNTTTTIEVSRNKYDAYYEKKDPIEGSFLMTRVVSSETQENHAFIVQIIKSGSQSSGSNNNNNSNSSTSPSSSIESSDEGNEKNVVFDTQHNPANTDSIPEEITRDSGSETETNEDSDLENEPTPKKYKNNITAFPTDQGSSSSSSSSSWQKLFRTTPILLSPPSYSINLNNQAPPYNRLAIYDEAPIKVLRDRIYALAMYPIRDSVMCAVGDTKGHIALWNYGDLQNPVNTVSVYQPHVRPVTGLIIDKTDHRKLYSSSYDSNLRCLDVEKETFDLIYEGDGGTCLDVSHDGNIIYLGSQETDLYIVDKRKPGGLVSTHELHEKKISSVSVNPDPSRSHILLTGSNDTNLCLWDLRSLKKKTVSPLHTFSHGAAISSALFSYTGNYFASVSYDSFLRSWEYSSNGTIAREGKVYHNNNVGRWITPFKLAFDPKYDHFATGSMKRQLEFWRPQTCTNQTTLVHERLTAIPSLNTFHHYENIVASSIASGRMFIWKEGNEKENESEDENNERDDNLESESELESENENTSNEKNVEG